MMFISQTMKRRRLSLHTTMTPCLLLLFLFFLHDVTALSQHASSLFRDVGRTSLNTDSINEAPAPSSNTLNVFIVRHGQSDANALNVIQGSGYKSRLTKKGQQQAMDVAVALENMLQRNTIHSVSVYCSPLQRAVSTWKIIQQECPSLQTTTDATILQDLREIDFYDWEGIDKTNLARMFPKEFQAWRQVKPDELVVYNSADPTQKQQPTQHYPLKELWERADRVWNEILILEGILSFSGNNNNNNNNNNTNTNNNTSPKSILIVAHGSLGQALLGVAMGWCAKHFRKHEFPNCGVAEIEWNHMEMFFNNNQQKRPHASRWRWRYPKTKNHLWKYHFNSDILRDLDGNLLTNEYFKRTMNIPLVQYFNTPKNDLSAFRGLMSDGARVQLYPSGNTAFYKRIVFSDLDHAKTKAEKAPFKLLRDTKSYQVVAKWMESKACRMLCQDTGVHIPKCYDAQVRADYTHPMESKFSFLLEDFNPVQGWYQEWLLDDNKTIHAALTTLAKIHAYFWHGSDFWKNKDAADELENAIWASGSYVQPKAQNDNQCFIVADEWDKKKQKFAEAMGNLSFWDDLGERLQSVCVEAGRLAHPFADDLENGNGGEASDTTKSTTLSSLSQQYRQYRTFTHGDPKQANFFFRQSDDDDELEVGLIDFQWSGFGLAATDVAHLLLSSVHADHLVNGGEERLQRYYYQKLQQLLVEYGAYADEEDVATQFSYTTFEQQYDTAVLDLTRLIVAYTWNRFTEAVEKNDKEGKTRTMNKTSYNKSVDNAVHLMSRCDKVLSDRGV